MNSERVPTTLQCSQRIRKHIPLVNCFIPSHQWTASSRVTSELLHPESHIHNFFYAGSKDKLLKHKFVWFTAATWRSLPSWRVGALGRAIRIYPTLSPTPFPIPNKLCGLCGREAPRKKKRDSRFKRPSYREDSRFRTGLYQVIKEEGGMPL